MEMLFSQRKQIAAVGENSRLLGDKAVFKYGCTMVGTGSHNKTLG